MPIVRDPLDPKISFWHFLAYYLRFEREKQGLSLTQWGQIIGAARSTVSNMEAGRHKIHDDQVKLIDGKFGTGRLFELLLWYARTAHNPDWFRQYTQYEADATIIRIYHGQVIPTPLQAEAYIRALLLASNVKDVEASVEARMARQDAMFSSDEPPEIWLLLDEPALTYEIGGPETMREQLRHLLKLGMLPNISIRLLPKSSGAHLGLDGPFRVISMESRDVAYAGAQRGGRLIEATGEVRDLRVDFERIGHKALCEDDSRTLIEQYLETYT
jgi:hypothetical protein